eukprot:gene24646-29779_t
MTDFTILNNLPFESMLVELRALSTTNSDAETTHQRLNDLANQLIQCRNSFSQKKSATSFLDHSKSIWNILNTGLPEFHSLYLPPLYTNNEHLEKILRHASVELLKRENQIVYGDSSNCGHLVIGGVEGVGKSTIFKALAIACAVLLDRMTPVYYLISEEHKSWLTVKQLLQRRFPLLEDSKFETASVTALLEHLSKQEGIEVTLFMDEFQRLFVENASDCDNGSSVNLRSYLFKNYDGNDPWRAQGYPNFNGTLYQFFFVPALRTTQSLKDFLQIRYPRWVLSDKEVADVFKFTGGLGRLVHVLYTNLSVDHMTLENWHIYNEKNSSLSSLPKGSDENALLPYLLDLNAQRRLGREQVMANDYYRSILAYFAAKLPGNLYASLAKSEIKNLLKELFRVTELEAVRIINQAVDHSVLYQEEQSIQVAVPHDIEYLCSNAQSSIPLLIKLTVVSFMVRGIIEGEKVIDVNAGIALELLVRGNVLSLLGDDRIKRGGCVSIELVHSAEHDGFRVFCDGIPSLQLPCTHPININSIDALKPLLGYTFQWKSEIGLDAWTIVSSIYGPPGTFDLIGWQCKGGRQDVRITPGVEKTMVDNYKKHGDLSKVDTSTIAGISVKAQVGFLVLMLSLEKIGVQVANVTLLLTTTKCVTSEALKLRSIPFNADLATEVTKRLNEKKVLKQLPTISLITVTGTGWITDCVDSEASEFAESLFEKGNDIQKNPLDVSGTRNMVVNSESKNHCNFSARYQLLKSRRVASSVLDGLGVLKREQRIVEIRSSACASLRLEMKRLKKNFAGGDDVVAGYRFLHIGLKFSKAPIDQ